MNETVKVNAQALGCLMEACAAVSSNASEYFKSNDEQAKADLEAIILELLESSAVVAASAMKGE